jgi:cytochrome P450
MNFSRVPPGPIPRFLFWDLGEFQSNGLPYLVELRRRYGDIVRYRISRWPIYLVSHPDDIQYVLKDNMRNFGKDTFIYREMGVGLGNGLLTSDGDFWHRQRRLAAPAFHQKRIEALGGMMTSATIDMLQTWDGYAARKQVFDIAAEMSVLTLRIVGQTLFRIDLTSDTDEIGMAVTSSMERMTHRLTSPLALPLRIPTPGNLRFRKVLQTLDRVVFDIIAERRRVPEDRGDLLSMFMLTEDEDTGERMTDKQLRDEVLTMLLAGHETSANVLTWTWYLLSRHPDVEAKLAAELREVLDGRMPAMHDLPRLTYAEMVLRESMRIYPVVYSFHRNAIAEDEIRGDPIAPGQVVAISPYVVHRHPEFWPDAEQFDPERFTPDRVAERHPFAYIPFAAGPRLCIGNRFALAEMQLILATVAQRYRLRPVAGQNVIPQAQVTLRPKHGIRATLEDVS